MKVIQFGLIGILTLITILWFGVSANKIAVLQGVFAWRSLLLQFTGILAMTSLSIGILGFLYFLMHCETLKWWDGGNQTNLWNLTNKSL
jgi:hypothetical protein